MQIRVRGLRLNLDYNEKALWRAAVAKLGIRREDIISLKLVRKAVDARRDQVYFTCTVDLELDDDLRLENNNGGDVSRLLPHRPISLQPGSLDLSGPPVIVGSGPAGLFCALQLARHGYRPVMIERGLALDQRVAAVETFWRQGVLNPAANTQFGEGGAGTFSDGKLTARGGDPRIGMVLDTFVSLGADPEIVYLKKPHVGTDIIREVVRRMRREILALGGEIYFQACLSDLKVNHGVIESIIINNIVEVPVPLLVMATGNSARDTYRMLALRGVQLTPKAFALGVRAEHPQEWLDRVQYGRFAGHPALGAADYHLAYQDRASGRGMYTFCMCPGGYVIAAASGQDQVVTNGMSYFARDTGVANTALVVTVAPPDWDWHPLGGMALQEELERRAFELGGGNYHAPAQLMADFVDRRSPGSLTESLATYKPGVTPADLWQVLPEHICRVLQEGIRQWERRMPGFIHEKAVLTGVETRTSAPLRVERDENLCALTVGNLYPCGEGSGYAGGIVSSAVDGLKAAERIISRYRRPGNGLKMEIPGVVSARDLKRVE